MTNKIKRSTSRRYDCLCVRTALLRLLYSASLLLMFATGCVKQTELIAQKTAVGTMKVIEDRATFREGDTLELSLILSNGYKRTMPISSHPGAFGLEHYRTPFSPYALFESVDGGYPMDSMPVLGIGETDTITVRFVRSRPDVEFDSVAVRAVYDFGVLQDGVLIHYHLHGLDHVVVVVEK